MTTKDQLAAQETARVEEQAAIEAAVTPAPTETDAAEDAARQAELDRQAEVVSAVAKAHKRELPKLGGPLMDPGLGR